MQHVTGRFGFPRASAASELKVLVDSGSRVTAIWSYLEKALRGQPGNVVSRINAGVGSACGCGDVVAVRA